MANTSYSVLKFSSIYSLLPYCAAALENLTKSDREFDAAVSRWHTTRMPKIIQISVSTTPPDSPNDILYALCEDGTVWVWGWRGDLIWMPLPDQG